MADADPLYTFGPFAVDSQRRLLLKDGYPVQLQAKAFDLLLVLLENPGRVVEKDELMNRVWQEQAVEEANLTVNMSALRKALGERAGEHRYIVTVPGRGYQWTGSASPAASAGPDARASNPRVLDPVIRRVIAITVAVVLIAAGVLVATGRMLRPQSRITSIAVLPFRPLVADVRDESLELGLADVLATRLGNIKELVVRPTSAIRKYARADQDPLRAGRELGVGAVLEGTIHRSGNTIRVTARLLRVADGGSLWAGTFDEAHHFIGLGYVGKRMYGSAATEFREALKLSQERLLIQAELGFAEGAAGNAPEARRILSDLQVLSRTRYVSPYYFAVIYAGLGDNDSAMAALEDAYRDRARRLWALGVVPTWDPLRSDPRFASLLKRIGLERR